MNNITVLGNLTGDPKRSKNTIFFGLADNAKKGDSSKTTFYSCILFNAGEQMNWILSFRKGDKVMVSGEIYTDEYKGKMSLKLTVNRIIRVYYSNREASPNPDINEGLDDLPSDDSDDIHF